MGRRTCLEHRGDARQALGPCPVPAASGSTDASVSTTPGGHGQGRFPEHTGHTRPGPLDRVPVGVWVTSPGGTEGEPVSARRLLVVPVALVSALGLPRRRGVALSLGARGLCRRRGIHARGKRPAVFCRRGNQYVVGCGSSGFRGIDAL